MSAAHLRPAPMALAGRWVAAAVGVAVLLVAFVAAVATLPSVAAVGVAAVLAVPALWLARRVSLVGQAGLLATADGLVVRLGTASTELAWHAVDAVAVTGSGRRVAVEVRAERLNRKLPRVFAPADARRWLHGAAELATLAGRDDLTVDGDALTAR